MINNFTRLLIVFWCVGVSANENKVAIASAHSLATQAGFEVIEQGGNVYDAAVAVAAALAVVEPAGSGLGGGGFFLLHRARDAKQVMLDAREKAPLAAHRDMYLDGQGRWLKQKSQQGALAAGIPGLPAALVHLSEVYGQLPLSVSLKPAIRHARAGFKIGARHQRLIVYRLPAILNNPATARMLLDNGETPKAGAVLKQPELANTLSLLAEKGRAGFYAGVVAEKMLESVKQGGGIWRQADLDQYQVIERQPVQGEYRGIKISSAALPSSGGIVLQQSLNILAAYPLAEMGKIERMHIISEAMRRAYHDRAMYLGDADFVEVPVEQLLSLDYAAGLRRSIRPDRALPSAYLAGELQNDAKGRNTTHFSIIDQQGNRVSATLSINSPFGAAFLAEGTGVLLNNEMDDFSSKVGTMNSYGLVGGVANAIEPGKRMLSSMTPTFLESDRHIAVLGTPGGSRIISMLLLAVLDFAGGGDPNAWVQVPRFHHQFIPDRIQFEKGGLTIEEQSALAAKGHQLKEVRYRYGNMQAVQLDKQTLQLKAASDPRGEGAALVR